MILKKVGTDNEGGENSSSPYTIRLTVRLYSAFNVDLNLLTSVLCENSGCWWCCRSGNFLTSNAATPDEATAAQVQWFTAVDDAGYAETAVKNVAIVPACLWDNCEYKIQYYH